MEIELTPSGGIELAARNREAIDLLARIRAIQAEAARLPVLDSRSPDEIVGYNEFGHFD